MHKYFTYIRTLSILTAATLLSAAPYARATARRAPTSQAALAMSTNGVNTIFLYLYGSDWNPAGTMIKQKIWDSPILADAFDDSICLVAVDQPETLERKISSTVSKCINEALKKKLKGIAHISCANKSIYKPMDDGSWLAEKSPNPATEIFTVSMQSATYPTPAILLELLTHKSLPGNGPGRDNGNVVISEVEASANGKPLKFESAWSDYTQKNFSPKYTIDGKKDNYAGWAIDGNRRHQDRKLVLTFQKPLPPQTKLTLKISCLSKWRAHTPGRIRISLLNSDCIAKAINDYNRFTAIRDDNKALSAGTDNYPAIICFGTDRKNYGRIQPVHLADSIAQTAKKMQTLVEKQKKAQHAWDMAQKSSGAVKAKYLGQWLELMGGPGGRRSPNQKIYSELKKNDPNDTNGYIRKWSFPMSDIRKRANEARDKDGPEAALKLIDAEFNSPKNARVSKTTLQDLLLLKFNICKSWKEHNADTDRVMQQIYQLDPNTHQGIGAKGWLMYRGRDKDFSLYHGWFPRHVKAGSHSWDITEGNRRALPTPGLYRISISARSGKSSLKINSLSFRTNGKTLSEDRHEATIKHRANKNNTYYLEWPTSTADTRPTLHVEYTADNGTDIRGSFSVTQILPEDMPPEVAAKFSSKTTTE